MSDGLSQTADLMSEASQNLDEIEPPDDVADAHQAMIDQSAAAADKLSEFADTVANASLADLQDTLAEFQDFEEFAALEEAVKDIEAAGYDIGGQRLESLAARARAVRAWRRHGASGGEP